MRHYELTHSHIATVTLDPARFADLRRLIENSREVLLLDVDDGLPDHWIIRVGCVSEVVREKFEDGWC
jgi:hypothetical protein